MKIKKREKNCVEKKWRKKFVKKIEKKIEKNKVLWKQIFER